MLEGKEIPKPDPDNVGTKNYSSKALAVVTGGGYDDEAFETMRKACEGKSSVPWLRPDLSVARPPIGPQYGGQIAERAKQCLEGLEKAGQGDKDGVYLY
jgi:hypothetical protein